MTKDFEARIMRERIVDTKLYRYIVKECGDHAEIQRLPLRDLDTTAAIDSWQTVKIIK